MKKVSTPPNEELLNIKQAAQFLNVSEVSLRRWTDKGKLHCLRVGGKRERRFRRQDLLDFLEHQSGSPQARTVRDESGKVTQIMLEGISIDYGNHLCALYGTDLGRLKLSVPFLSDGLRKGDRCYLVASESAQEDILQNLSEIGIDVAAATHGTQLVVHPGAASGTEMYEFLERSFVLDSRTGDRRMRVLGDMAWAMENNVSVEDLMAFETRYNHSLARRFAVISLCQYDVRRFSGTGVLDALRYHEDTFRYPLSRFLGL